MNLGIISGQICPLACTLNKYAWLQTYCIIQFQHHSKTKYLSFFSNSVQKLVNAFITSSMDNCNLFLSGHSKSSLKSLHLIILINSPQWNLQSGFNWHCSLYWQILLSSFERKQKGNKRSINGTEWNPYTYVSSLDTPHQVSVSLCVSEAFYP